MSDDRQGSFQDGPPARGPLPADRAGGSELDRLPPPAFPPGQRATFGRRNHRPVAESHGDGRSGAAPELPDAGVPAEVFISPDEPIVRSSSRIAPGAFISPDEPMPQRGQSSDNAMDDEEGVVTGIGDDPHLELEDLTVTLHSDPAVADLVVKVGRLAEALRDRGEAGLRTTPDMNRFEATLRAYCVGYLAGQREVKPE